MARQTLAWLITMYYTIGRQFFRALLVLNSSLLRGKKMESHYK